MAQSSLSVLFFLHEDKICMLFYCNGQIKALNTNKQVTQDKLLKQEKERRKREKNS